jgi:hypothetical protein
LLVELLHARERIGFTRALVRALALKARLALVRDVREDLDRLVLEQGASRVDAGDVEVRERTPSGLAAQADGSSCKMFRACP